MPPNIKEKKRRSVLGAGFIKLFKKKKKNEDAQQTDTNDPVNNYDSFFPYIASNSPRETLRSRKILSVGTETDKRVFKTFQIAENKEDMTDFFVDYYIPESSETEEKDQLINKMLIDKANN